MAHDFNTILAAVMGNAGYLQMTLSGDEPALEVVGEIERAATKGAELVGQLVAFSRSQELKPRIVEVDVAVAEFLKMTRPIMGSGVRVETDVADDLWSVSIDPTQLDQVLMNLVVNARDAMADGGTLIIETANVSTCLREKSARCWTKRS